MSRPKEVEIVTVAELATELRSLPPDATVHAYEGEGGSWIVVRVGDRELAAFHTLPS